MKAIYRLISGWPGYWVGDDGSVWSRRDYRGGTAAAWHRLSPRADRDGYLSVTLYRDRRRNTVKVAHLVLEAFIGPRPDGTESAHWPDTDVRNNAATNLRWTEHHDNILDKVRGGTVARGEGHGSAKLTEDDVRAIRAAYRPRQRGFGYIATGRRFGISGNQVRLIVTRRNWGHVADHPRRGAVSA